MIDIRTGKPMTRRSALTGLAGILAAGVAPAAVVKSMIGARGVATSGKAGWKNPYVTDGLVAMWDGEWNAGIGGEHLSSISEWIDLVRRNSFGLNENQYFGSNYLLNRNTRAGNRINLSEQSKTIEVCFIPAVYEDYGTILVSDNSFGFRVNGRFVRFTNGGNTISTILVGEIKTASIVNISSDTWYGFDNGVYSSSQNGTLGTELYFSGLKSIESRPQFGKYFNIRMYNRAITENEMNHNRNVDLDRFLSN